MPDSRVLIVFIKNPVKGKVKTRLAKSVGEDEALKIYEKLLDITMDTAASCEAEKQLWFSDYIPESSRWEMNDSVKKVQAGANLGIRMSRSFQEAFDSNYGKAVIIGSDCAELSAALLNRAFEKLDEYELVLGPSRDGGYYLLGMNRFHRELFKDIPWSTDSVLSQTLAIANDLNLKVHLLSELNDIDCEADWRQVKDHFNTS